MTAIPKTNDGWLLYDFSDAGKDMHDETVRALYLAVREVDAGGNPGIAYADQYRRLLDGPFARYEAIGALDTEPRSKLWDLMRADARKRYGVDLGNRMPA